MAAPLLALLATVLLGGPALAAPATGPATRQTAATASVDADTENRSHSAGTGRKTSLSAIRLACSGGCRPTQDESKPAASPASRARTAGSA